MIKFDAGKTELGRRLAEKTDVGPTNVDLSRHMKEGSVGRLVGAPSGYVGYGEGGLLDKTVAQAPHGVILLDEIEPPHRSVFDVLKSLPISGRALG